MLFQYKLPLPLRIIISYLAGAKKRKNTSKAGILYNVYDIQNIPHIKMIEKINIMD